MLIPDSIESKLKFDRIRRAVEEFCLTSIGKCFAARMSFMTDIDSVRTQTGRTAEMAAILESQVYFPASELPDLREGLRRIRVDGLYLDEEELSALRVSLKLSVDVINFFGDPNGFADDARPDSCGNPEYPLLSTLAAELTPYPLTIQLIDRVLSPDGIIKDNATPKLSEIRSEIKSSEAAALRRMNAILKKAQTDGFVDSDASVSIRDGVAVIPIPAANKRALGGVVVDESATGRTAFVQPAEVVAINARLSELRSEERREVIRILKDVSSNIRPYAPEMIHSIEALGEIDFVRGKALYAKEIDATLPIIDEDKGFYLSGARHPLLMKQLAEQGKKIVPLNIELEAPMSRILLISGPNAGGKSVCLQTVGLLQLMLQCGLLVPVNEGSRMCVFRNLFIDIGDNQSIDNDLSTYSSHLLAMKNFVKNSDGETLILIDEFGTGTEPLVGGAIAQAVLDELNRLGAFGVLTTHYTNLKHFAAQTEGLINGAMTFDTQKIEPKFSLLIGQPGSSFAFEIAHKIGLPDKILQNAKNAMGQDNADFDRNLRQINRDKHYWEQKRQNVKENDKKLAETLSKYNEMLESVRSERKQIIANAKEQAQELLKQANKRIENTILEIRKNQAEKEQTKKLRQSLEEFKGREVESLKDEDEHIERKMAQIRQRQARQKEKQTDIKTEQVVQKKEEEGPLKDGDYVIIDGKAEHVGQILSLKGKTAQVAIGNLLTSVKIDRLQRISANKARRSGVEKNKGVDYSNVAASIREKKLNFKAEIDLRGMRGEEALQEVARFLDDAVMCEASQIRILHGKGNGILRQMIRQYLKGQSCVADAHDENVQFGGAGITVVDLK